MHSQRRHTKRPLHLLDGYRRGEFSDVAAAIDDEFDASGSLPGDLVNLRARLYIKTDPPAGLQFLSRQSRSLKGAELAEATMLTAVLYARSRDERLTELSFNKASAMIEKLRAPALQDELTYHRGLWLWTNHRLQEAEELAVHLRSSSVKGVRARAKVLESVIASVRERYFEQAALSLEAYRLAMEDDDVEMQAYTTRNLATLARELPMPQLRDVAKGAVERVPWTRDLREEQFKALKAAGWCCALDGDYLNAFRLLKAASAVAPSDHWRVMAALDRAYLARCLGEPRWSEQELLEANMLARSLDWRGRTSEEHVALVLLAELYAEIDGALSLAYLARFRELGPVVKPTEAFAHDRRLGALADHSTGVVHARLGDTQAAIANLEAAWEVLSTVHYDWRAGRTAIELYKLTKKSIWNERAQEKLAGYPLSWLAGQVVTTEPRSGLSKLSPAQRRVFEMLIAGRSTGDVAAALGRSVFTVRNHIRAIFLAFDVKSRAALVAEAARLKLIA
jgi:DNA-binding CsgD family transcriptional regulator